MKEFDELLAIADRLLAPNGCPWDREQTFFTLQPYLLEETHELLEAIDLQDPAKISEELGDVLYALIFIAKLNEKNYPLATSVQTVADKLIRRHPHIFDNKKISSSDEVVSNWEAIKKKEGKKSPIDNIPPSLPSLARAQKVIHKLRRAKSPIIEETLEDSIGQKIFDLVRQAEAAGIDAESALRRTTQIYEEKHRR